MLRIRVRLRFTLLGATLLSAPAPSAAPSFDCQRATHAIEKLICSDAKLSALDAQMAELFGDVMRQTSGSRKQELLSEQRGWIKNRNACAKRSEPRRGCVLEHYTQRNSRLEALLAEGSDTGYLETLRSVRYRCDDGREIAAAFVPGNPTSVRLARGKATWTLPLVVSGSGARYAKDQAAFWTKGAEALFQHGGNTVKCRESG